MFDLGVLQYLGSGQVSRLSYIGDRLQLTGSGFTEATDVQVNGASSPSWVVLSDTRIVADIHPRIVGNPITSIRVLTSVPKAEGASLVQFVLGNRRVEDLEALSQRYIRVLLTTPGSDIFTDSGGGVQRLAASTLDEGGLRMAAMRAVEDTTQVVRRSDNKLPTRSRLATAVLVGCERSPNSGLRLRVRLRSVAQEEATTGLTI